MEHRAILYGFATVATTLLTFGLVLPALISAKSDVLVMTGFVGVFASAWAIYELVKMTIAEVKKTKGDKN